MSAIDPQSIKIITTEDGSHSLYLPHLNETYHSFHGAWRESIHVYIKCGLAAYHEQHPEQKEIVVFEVGFGTGLNALLALEYADTHQVKVHFHSIEAFPLEEKFYKEMNYTAMDPSFEKYSANFLTMHEVPWEADAEISPYFTLHKTKGDLLTYPFESDVYDVVFYDAFAPRKQPELWSVEILEKVATAMKSGGIFTTYSAQGQLKRNLEAAHLQVSKVPGPPGKKEMLTAVKTI